MFIGREEYLEDLESLWQKGTSSLVACRGRRRIGKSTLFREFARRTADVYLEIEGLMPEPAMTNEMQLRGFAESLAAQTVLIYEGKLDPVVEGNGYFDAVIPVSKLLGVVQYRGAPCL